LDRTELSLAREGWRWNCILDGDLPITLLGLLVLLTLSGSTSAALAALQRVNKARVRFMASEGISRARAILDLSEQADSMETTAAAANVGVLVATAAVGAVTLANLLGGNTAAAYVAGAAGLAAVLWLQLATRALGARRPEETLYLLQRPLWILHAMFRPVDAILNVSVRWTLPSRDELAAGVGQLSDEDFRSMVDAVEEEGALEEGEREMIHGIFEMGERTAREIMVPRVDMVAVEADQPLRSVLELVKTRAHSRIPIYGDNIDNVVGVVYAKDLLRYMDTGSLDEPASTLARAPHFIPESKKTDELLHEMQKNKVHIAIVVDEYGGTAGLVTIEDLLEEIVGEIHDEYDVEEKWIEKLDEGAAVCNARVNIHDLNDALGIELTNGEYDTVGGLVYHHLGKIPAVGDTVKKDGICLTVLSTAGKRITKVKIQVEQEDCETHAEAGRQ
jgi:putative hemolysin